MQTAPLFFKQPKTYKIGNLFEVIPTENEA